eukprot:tig00000692_g3278.t1
MDQVTSADLLEVSIPEEHAISPSAFLSDAKFDSGALPAPSRGPARPRGPSESPEEEAGVEEDDEQEEEEDDLGPVGPTGKSIKGGFHFTPEGNVQFISKSGRHFQLPKRSVRRLKIQDFSHAGVPTLLDDMEAAVGKEVLEELRDGNELLSDAALVRREKLKFDPGIISLQTEFWRACDANHDGKINKEEYISLSMLFYRALHKKWDPKRALECAQEDWEFDRRGRTTLGLEEFRLALFQLVDLWTEGVDLEEYDGMLTRLLDVMTARDDSGQRRLKKLEEIRVGEVFKRDEEAPFPEPPRHARRFTAPDIDQKAYQSLMGNWSRWKSGNPEVRVGDRPLVGPAKPTPTPERRASVATSRGASPPRPTPSPRPSPRPALSPAPSSSLDAPGRGGAQRQALRPRIVSPFSGAEAEESLAPPSALLRGSSVPGPVTEVSAVRSELAAMIAPALSAPASIVVSEPAPHLLPLPPTRSAVSPSRGLITPSRLPAFPSPRVIRRASVSPNICCSPPSISPPRSPSSLPPAAIRSSLHGHPPRERCRPACATLTP